MHRLLFCALLLVLSQAACTAPQRSAQAPPAETAPDPTLPEHALDRARLEAHLRFLASDELMGRDTGTPGGDAAARYIAEQFRAAGAQPAPGRDDYLQPVAFRRVPTARGRRLVLESDAPDQDTAEDAAEAVVAHNVAGFVEGSDPARRDEVVVLMAHYDHVGAGMNRGPGATPADSIFNGARDNAMGVVALIGAAKALAARPPARSVLLLAVTGEEYGMLGSRHYAEHPLVPLERTVYALNIDGAGYSDTSAVTVVGLGRTTADDAIRAGTAAFGLDVLQDPVPEQNLFDRSDNVSLARKGVPAPTFSGGFHAFSDPGVGEYYHNAADEANTFDFAYLQRFVQAYAHTARRIANLPERPRWVEGDKYEEAARALYGER